MTTSNGRGVAVTGLGFVTPIGNDLETVLGLEQQIGHLPWPRVQQVCR